MKEGIPFISVEAIVNNKIDFKRKRGYISNEYNEKCNQKYKPQKNDVYLVKSGSTVGKTAIVETNIPFNIWSPLAALRPNNATSPYFLFYLLQTDNLQSQVINKSKGGTQPNLSMRLLEHFKIFVPNNIDYQTQIARLLINVDKIISLQQRKLNELKEVKKTLLSQLFPSKGQYRPIIRFKKFTNKWTKRKLGNIAKIIGGGTPSTSNHDYWNGNINWYSPTEIGNNIFVNSSNKKISIKGLNNSSAKLLPGGKTILFTSRAGIGNMAIMLTDGCTNQGFQSWVIDDTKIDIYFLYSLGRLLKHDAIRQASGSTFLEISNKEVKKLLLEIPSFTEQKLIGNMLRKIDDDIVRQKERIILITKIKKNLLQKLFV
ncbi:restriction modification system DNA specificity domain protein [Lactobacillus amylovorus GRL 1112]|uniref:Restriction modification system DNA specificity domain protein n=2 Tax=Lactobacillus amylovorus TaxID=1604 RepID=E4SIP6_LACAR|nr:restriction modification system DNA specificity domain protein [Lactobacillus amylovorus GRL 1112]